MIRALFAIVVACACVATPPVEGVAVAQDGARIAYDVRGAGEPALVFVHCWAGDRDFWREQLDEFASDYRVVALDLGGHGESDAHASPSLAVLAGDVTAVVDQLALERFVLIGHSLGGPVSLAAAAALRGRVIGVVGVETMHDVEMDVPRERVEQMLAAFEADYAGSMRGAVRAMLPERTPHELVEWITSRACATDPSATLAIARALVGTDLPALLGGARVPVRGINSAGRPPFIPETSI